MAEVVEIAPGDGFLAAVSGDSDGKYDINVDGEDVNTNPGGAIPENPDDIDAKAGTGVWDTAW